MLYRFTFFLNIITFRSRIESIESVRARLIKTTKLKNAVTKRKMNEKQPDET